MKNEIDTIKIGQEVIATEIYTLEKLQSTLDNNFAKAVEVLANTSGKVILSGVGKSGLIARKIASTLSSTGTPSFFLHPTEAAHGELGVITSQDTVITLSNSGESDELLNLLPFIMESGSILISICGDADSTLARSSSISIIVNVEKEACSFNLSPTSSTTAQIALGDALAIATMQIKQFKKSKFASIHPCGNIGRILTEL